MFHCTVGGTFVFLCNNYLAQRKLYVIMYNHSEIVWIMGVDYISRTMEDIILESSKYFSVISVTGPRQSGKSTLIKHLFPQYEKYSMKDLHIREFAENDPVAFLNQHPEGMFIDEMQKVSKLLDYI